MASTSWDAQGEAQAALRAIVSDPQYGAAALSNPQTMTNLLKDLLPDEPREASVLVAASEAGVATSLQSYMSQGMDLGTASRLAAGSFENRTALTPQACTWVVGALATALRLNAAPAPQEPAAATVPPPGNQPGNQQTMAPPGAAGAWAPPPSPAWPGPPVAGAGAVAAPGTGASRIDGLKIAAAVVAVIGAILTIWACALPDLHVTGATGRQYYSIFNTGSGGGAWFAAEPVGVAVLGIVAAVALLAAARAPRLRVLAAGMLIAFGIQTMLLFLGYEGSPQSSLHQQAGVGSVVGILGGLLLLVAGVLGAIGRAAPTAATPRL